MKTFSCRHVLGCVALAVALLPVATPTASAGGGGGHLTHEALDLDTRGVDGAPGPTVSTQDVLVTGVRYVVTIAGTYSRWSAATWQDSRFHTSCGEAEHTAAGPVGADAEVSFAEVRSLKNGQSCTAAPLPSHNGLLLMSTGGPFTHSEPAQGFVTQPRADHRYAYLIVGAGAPLSVRLTDAVSSDNYGTLRITVRRWESYDVSLDSYRSSNVPDPTTTSSPFALAAGRRYTVTVSGTWSRWKAASWSSRYHVVCGLPLSAPSLPSTGTTNGKVGLDAEVAFAQVRSKKSSPPCSTAPPPTAVGYFQILLGSTWSHPTADAASSEPSAHEYTYIVTGGDSQTAFRLRDGVTQDNYGVLSIHLEEIVE